MNKGHKVIRKTVKIKEKWLFRNDESNNEIY